MARIQFSILVRVAESDWDVYWNVKSLGDLGFYVLTQVSCSPGCPGTYCRDKDDLELLILLVYEVLGTEYRASWI